MKIFHYRFNLSNSYTIAYLFFSSCVSFVGFVSQIHIKFFKKYFFKCPWDLETFFFFLTPSIGNSCLLFLSLNILCQGGGSFQRTFAFVDFVVHFPSISLVVTYLDYFLPSNFNFLFFY